MFAESGTPFPFFSFQMFMSLKLVIAKIKNLKKP